MPQNSEVARIRRQITLEYESANRIFNEPGIVSRHDFIEARQVRLADCFEELAKYMSKEEAMTTFLDASGESNNGK